MTTPNYVIELMPTDALINHANALQKERAQDKARIATLEAEIIKINRFPSLNSAQGVCLEVLDAAGMGVDKLIGEMK